MTWVVQRSKRTKAGEHRWYGQVVWLAGSAREREPWPLNRDEITALLGAAKPRDHATIRASTSTTSSSLSAAISAPVAVKSSPSPSPPTTRPDSNRMFISRRR